MLTHPAKPLFIVIEGIDGSGKSTQIALLKDRLEKDGQRVQLHHEPTEGPIGKMIRGVLAGDFVLDGSAFAALYLADRLDHITHPERGMLAALHQGSHVISSRYYFSTYAFQGEFAPMEWLVSLNSRCKNMLKADLTIYLNIDPEVSLHRITTSRESLDIYENEDKQVRTHKAFLQAFEQYGADENIVIIDAAQSIEAVHAAIWAAIVKLFD